MLACRRRPCVPGCNKWNCYCRSFRRPVNSRSTNRSVKRLSRWMNVFRRLFDFGVNGLKLGYLLLEDISDDRRFETWYAKSSPRLEALGIEVSHAISDRAKALIKRALAGFECDSGADLFHAQQDFSRWLGSKLARQVSTAEKHLTMAQAAEEKTPETASTAERQELKEQSLNARKDYDQARQVQTTYHENLRGVSDAIHPFSSSTKALTMRKRLHRDLKHAQKRLNS